LIHYEKLLCKKLFEVFKNNKDLIFDNWISLIEDNVEIQEKIELDSFIEVFKNILDNYINYFKDGNIGSYLNSNMEIAKQMAFNNVSYRYFMKNISYFQESYIGVIVRSLAMNDIDKCITLSNRVYNKALEDIIGEYFNIKDSTLTALLKLAELRDDETGKHAERAKDYAILLSTELSLDEQYINDMSKASLLHDIGKIAISDKLMLKPEKLTYYEFEEMKKHTVIGARTIIKVINVNDSINGYLFMAIDIALSHHEKYDGSGYPNALLGSQIPLSARIFAVADAYDAITSKRPYKGPLSHEEAVRRIVLDSDKHFDPEIINAFIRIQDKFKIINKRTNKAECNESNIIVA